MPPKRQLSVQGSSGQASEAEPSARASKRRGLQQADANPDANPDVTREEKRKITHEDPDSNYQPTERDSSSEDLDSRENKRQKSTLRKSAPRKSLPRKTAPRTTAPRKTAPRKPAISPTTGEMSDNDMNSDADDDANDEVSGNTKGVDRSLPPITNVEEAFQDLVQNKPKAALDELANAGGFKIRVATMCSGTDAPIFALELIDKAFKTSNPNHNRLMEIEHVFSVEYLDWKAAFIHRNTSAKVFSDVRDFGSEQSEAYVHCLIFIFIFLLDLVVY